jgi:hypothetical protein
MDQWLTYLFLEGGGGDEPESYDLAMYFLATHTATDCLEKRRKRAYAFLTGDAPTHKILSRHHVEAIVGDRLDDDLKAPEIVAELQKSFVPFFVIPDPGRRRACERGWRDLIGDHVLCLENAEDVCLVTAGAVALCEHVAADLDAVARVLRDAGTPKDRVASTVRALKPLAEVTR